MNRINAYRQMLPADFDVGTMPSLRPIPENNISPPRFGQFGFPIYGNKNIYSNSLSSLSSSSENGGDLGSGGTKRAKLFRLANQAARGFGK
uniref:Uncharacterized protein n=1 Tax=Panagrolaimus sp. ES5 TaxID=591445 RepID=A0AC34FYE9_9BILA